MCSENNFSNKYLVRFSNYGKEYNEILRTYDFDNYKFDRDLKSALKLAKEKQNKYKPWVYLNGCSSNLIIETEFKNNIKKSYLQSIKIKYFNTKRYCMIYALTNILQLNKLTTTIIIKLIHFPYTEYATLANVLGPSIMNTGL